jgi:hypothetical protein
MPQVIIRKRGVGFMFQPYDNMVLAHANKITKSGRITRSIAYKTGKLIETRMKFTPPSSIECSYPGATGLRS